MSKIIYFEDMVTCALFLNYILNQEHLLSFSKIKEFEIALEEEISKKGFNEPFIHPLDNSSRIYFYSKDENGNEYYILKHDFDYEKTLRYLQIFPDSFFDVLNSPFVLQTLYKKDVLKREKKIPKIIL